MKGTLRGDGFEGVVRDVAVGKMKRRQRGTVRGDGIDRFLFGCGHTSKCRSRVSGTSGIIPVPKTGSQNRTVDFFKSKAIGMIHPESSGETSSDDDDVRPTFCLSTPKQVLRSVVLGGSSDRDVAITSTLEQQQTYKMIVSQHHAALCLFSGPLAVNLLRLMTSSDISDDGAFIALSVVSLFGMAALTKVDDPGRLGKIIGGATFAYLLLGSAAFLFPKYHLLKWSSQQVYEVHWWAIEALIGLAMSVMTKQLDIAYSTEQAVDVGLAVMEFFATIVAFVAGNDSVDSTALIVIGILLAVAFSEVVVEARWVGALLPMNRTWRGLAIWILSLVTSVRGGLAGVFYMSVGVPASFTYDVNVGSNGYEEILKTSTTGSIRIKQARSACHDSTDLFCCTTLDKIQLTRRNPLSGGRSDPGFSVAICVGSKGDRVEIASFASTESFFPANAADLAEFFSISYPNDVLGPHWSLEWSTTQFPGDYWVGDLDRILTKCRDGFKRVYKKEGDRAYGCHDQIRDHCRTYKGGLTPFSNIQKSKFYDGARTCHFGSTAILNEVVGSTVEVTSRQHTDAQKLMREEDAYCTLRRATTGKDTVKCTLYAHRVAAVSGRSFHEAYIITVGFLLGLTTLAVELVENKAESTRGSGLLTAGLGMFYRLRRMSSSKSRRDVALRTLTCLECAVQVLAAAGSVCFTGGGGLNFFPQLLLCEGAVHWCFEHVTFGLTSWHFYAAAGITSSNLIPLFYSIVIDDVPEPWGPVALVTAGIQLVGLMVLLFSPWAAVASSSEAPNTLIEKFPAVRPLVATLWDPPDIQNHGLPIWILGWSGITEVARHYIKVDDQYVFRKAIVSLNDDGQCTAVEFERVWTVSDHPPPQPLGIASIRSDGDDDDVEQPLGDDPTVSILSTAPPPSCISGFAH